MKLPIFLIITVIVLGCRDNSKLKTDEATKDTTLKILTYGLPDMEENHARNSVGKKYGFTYYPVAGCVVPKELLDSIHQENKKVYEILSRKLGQNWRTKFEQEVDTMRQLQSKIEKLIKAEKYIIEKDESLNKENNQLYYDIDFTSKKNVFEVKAYGWGRLNNKDDLLVYYKASFDLNMKSAKLLSSNVEKR